VPAEPAPELPALVLYTSGTTGPPKGVVLSRAAVAADLDALAGAWAWTPDDTLVHGLPLYHVHGLVLGVLGPLRLGSRLAHTGKPTPEAYATTPGTMFFGVPTVWSRVAAVPDAARRLSPARLLVSGSAPLPSSVFDRLRALTGQAPVERYGMTETLITVSARADGERRAGQVGLPLAGIDTRLVDEAGAPLPADGVTIGHLQVRGPTLLDGYLRAGGVEPPVLAGGWYPTGDVATVGADGWHRIVGRASTDLIKTGGYRVGAGEVEDALLLHPAVREAAVIGLPHADLGEQITAFVVADPVAPADLIAFVAERLAAHKRPRAVHLVDALPRNAMGKVQKNRLRV
jgi:fatty acid CoA ligase FadD36